MGCMSFSVSHVIRKVSSTPNALKPMQKRGNPISRAAVDLMCLTMRVGADAVSAPLRRTPADGSGYSTPTSAASATLPSGSCLIGLTRRSPPPPTTTCTTPTKTWWSSTTATTAATTTTAVATTATSPPSPVSRPTAAVPPSVRWPTRTTPPQHVARKGRRPTR